MDGALGCLPTTPHPACLLHSVRNPTQKRLSLTSGMEEGKKGHTPLSGPLILIPSWFCYVWHLIYILALLHPCHLFILPSVPMSH